MKNLLYSIACAFLVTFMGAQTATEQRQKDHKASPPKKEHLSATEKAAEKLVEQFLDEKNKKLSWKCFAQVMADLAKKDKKYTHLAKTFEELATSKSSVYIGWALEEHTDTMPAQAKKHFDKKKKLELMAIVDMRISLNEKAHCNRKKLIDELLGHEDL